MSDDIFCENCIHFLHAVRSPHCEVCGKPLFACVCKNKRKNPTFEKCVSAFEYNNKAISLIFKIKGKGSRKAVSFVALKMSEIIETELKDIKFDCITFVPTSKFSRMRKGFDHSKLLAKEIAKIINVPLVYPPIKSKNIVGLKFQDGKTRKEAVKRKFKEKQNKCSINGVVLLVDDVMTTGETLLRCSELLKDNGANKIYCVTAATVIKKA